MKLIRRSFAFVYLGTIVDQTPTEPLSESISKQLNSDMTSAQEAHEVAVQRGLVRSLKKARTHLLMSATISRLD